MSLVERPFEYRSMSLCWRSSTRDLEPFGMEAV